MMNETCLLPLLAAHRRHFAMDLARSSTLGNYEILGHKRLT
jgi:hypothetical protein